jgi:hypothetical protein
MADLPLHHVLRVCHICRRLAAMLMRFPLPRGSAEGEVIASSIAARCWLSERQVGNKLPLTCVPLLAVTSTLCRLVQQLEP